MKLAFFVTALLFPTFAVGKTPTENLRAYWLTDTDPKTSETYGPLLVFARVPLKRTEAIDNAENLRDNLGKGQTGVVYILDEPAFFVETYQRDSVWNKDRRPIKPFIGAIRHGKRQDTIVAFGRQYKIEPAESADVIRLLENPEGTTPIHRLHAPFAGAEQTARALILLLKDQIEHSMAEGRTRR